MFVAPSDKESEKRFKESFENFKKEHPRIFEENPENPYMEIFKLEGGNTKIITYFYKVTGKGGFKFDATNRMVDIFDKKLSLINRVIEKNPHHKKTQGLIDKGKKIISDPLF